MNSSIDPVTTGDVSPATSSGLVARMQAGVALNMVAAVFNQGSTLLVNLVVANLLGRETFGEYTMVLATIATLGTLGQMSMGYTATKHIAEFRSIDKPRTSRILTLCAVISGVAALIASLLLAVGGGWIARGVLDAPALDLPLRIAAAAVFFTVLNGFLAGTLAGLEGYGALARAGIVSGTAYAVICAGLAWRFGLAGAVTGLGVSALVQSATMIVFLNRELARQAIPWTRSGVWQEKPVVMHFALPATIGGALYQPATWIGTALLAKQPNGFDHLALFGAANMFRTMVLFVPYVINNVGMAVLNNQRRSNPRGFRNVFWLNAGLSVTAAIAAVMIILSLGSTPLRLFGPTFVEGRTVLAVMLGAAILEALTLAVNQLVVSRGQIWRSLAFVSVPRDLALVVVALLSVPAWQAAGLGAAHAAAWGISLAGVVGISYWHRNIKQPALTAPVP